MNYCLFNGPCDFLYLDFLRFNLDDLFDDLWNGHDLLNFSFDCYEFFNNSFIGNWNFNWDSYWSLNFNKFFNLDDL